MVNPLVRNIETLNAAVLAAIERGEQTVTIKLPCFELLAILEEIRDRRPRNYSRLIADDTIERLNAAIDRIECGRPQPT